MATDQPPLAGEAGAQATTEAKRPKPTKTLPTSRIAFAKQLDLLRIYAAMHAATSRPVNAADAAGVLDIAAGTVSLANPFFVDIGLLLRSEGAGFVPSPDVINFHRAHEWNKDTAAQKLAPAVSATWFAQALGPRLAFKELNEADAIAVLAEASAAAPDYRPQLGLLLSYMEAAGLIQREGGVVRQTRSAAVVSTPLPVPTADLEKRAGSAAQVSTSFNHSPQGGVQFQIAVNVDMAEFSGWSPDRITAFFAGIAQVLAAKGRIEKDVSN